MEELLELLIMLLKLILVFIFLLGLLLVVWASVVYIVGYIYDSIFGDSLIRLGHFVGSKCPKIKDIPIVVKYWRKFKGKNCI